MLYQYLNSYNTKEFNYLPVAPVYTIMARYFLTSTEPYLCLLFPLKNLKQFVQAFRYFFWRRDRSICQLP